MIFSSISKKLIWLLPCILRISTTASIVPALHIADLSAPITLTRSISYAAFSKTANAGDFPTDGSPINAEYVVKRKLTSFTKTELDLK